MRRLERMGWLFGASLLGTAGAFAGLIAGTLYAFGGFFYDLLTGPLNLGTALAFGALVGMPAIGAAFGFVLGALFAPTYNVLARRFGGLHADVDLG